MKAGITQLPYTPLDKQIDLSGNREFYRLDYHEAEDTCLWDSQFIKTLDKYLINPTQVTKSEVRQIEAFLSHMDKHMSQDVDTQHDTQVLETLDKLFLESTQLMMKGY